MTILTLSVIYPNSVLQVPDRQAGESKIAEPKALKEHISQARKVQPSVPQELTEYVEPRTLQPATVLSHHPPVTHTHTHTRSHPPVTHTRRAGT